MPGIGVPVWSSSLKVSEPCFLTVESGFEVHFGECVLLSWYTRGSIWPRNENPGEGETSRSWQGRALLLLVGNPLFPPEQTESGLQTS